MLTDFNDFLAHSIASRSGVMWSHYISNLSISSSSWSAIAERPRCRVG